MGKAEEIKKAVKISTAKGDFCIVPVKSHAFNYGVMGIELKNSESDAFLNSMSGIDFSFRSQCCNHGKVQIRRCVKSLNDSTRAEPNR